MQIGDNLYIDLEIKDSSEKDFLTYADVMDLKVVETAGASLPYVYMSFLCRNEKAMNSIQLGNSLKVTIGNTPSNADTFEVDIIPPQPNKDPSGTGWVVEFAGFIGNKEYMIGQKSEAYLGNSLIVVDKVLKDYLGEPKNSKYYVKTDFTHVNEDQLFWRKNNQTACVFVANTLLHCDVRPSFPLFAFDKYKNFYVKDLSKLITNGATWIFSSASPTNTKTIQYFNNFTVESFKNEYNLYSGYNKVTEIYNSATGLSESIIDENEPILAATSQAEESYAGNLVQMNDIQGPNVHKNYNAAFAHNTNKLMALSSMLGCLVLLGDYHKELKPLDLVDVHPGDTNDPSIGGLYLIDSIVTEADFASGGIRTLVYVTRDNKNNVENYVTEQESRLKNALNILKQFKSDLLASIHSLKVAYAMGQQFFDGTYLERVMNFALLTKRNVLRSFSIAGVTIDFNSKANLLNSLICTGNSLMNTLVSMVFPEGVAYALWDFILYKPSLISMLSKYASEYIPFEVRDIFMLLAESIFKTTNTLNSIAKDNGIQVNGSTGEAKVDETDKISNEQQKVNNIISSFENNTTGLDVPFPIVKLDESEALLPEEELRNLVADKTIANLTDLNYLENVDKDKFKEILLGQETIDFNIINEINSNAGNVLSYRLWGTYNDTATLDSLTIKKGYKDKYRTLPCTKLVSALQNSKLFFACPAFEEDVKFYINSKRVELESFETDLGYVDVYGNKIMYNVYYTEEGYNSNSVMLEVKQGGMV